VMKIGGAQTPFLLLSLIFLFLSFPFAPLRSRIPYWGFSEILVGLPCRGNDFVFNVFSGLSLKITASCHVVKGTLAHCAYTTVEDRANGAAAIHCVSEKCTNYEAVY